MVKPWIVRCLLFVLVGAAASAPLSAQEGDGYWEGQLADARRNLRKGELSSAESLLEDIVAASTSEEEPEDGRPPKATVELARLALCDIHQRVGDYEKARDGLAALGPETQARRETALLRARIAARLGDYDGAIGILQGLVERDGKDVQARAELAEMCRRAGRREEARKLWQQNVDGPRPTDGLQLAYLGRSLWRLGGRKNLEAASGVLVESMKLNPELAEARTTYGLIKFEAFGETMGFETGEKDLKKVLEAHGDDEEALLAMYRVRSANMALDGGKTERFLERALTRNPRCVAAITLRASNVLDDRRYRDAARLLDSALAVDGNDKVTLCHRAAAAWLLHDKEGHGRFRARALAGDPGWPDADRILADHLVALYRFADALPFYAAARAVAPDDVPTLHGMAKALVYTGAGSQAKELLERAKEIDAGLVNAWRNNSLAVQQLLDSEYTLVEHGSFKMQMHRADAEVLRAYLMPVHLQAAEVLGAKYGWQPQQPVRVEVFHTWDDFSVRTIGFRGFTALGACFGSLITLVSPGDNDLRRQDFMWEATAWHEYTHVLTLGLSNHRVPRWLTEGFSVYEEKVRDKTWERGMDRELFDAFHNDDIPPVHLLNRLFRGPRILFGYYQGGLIVELIARDHGFAKAIDLLRAFGEDLDTEDAFEKALGISSAAFDTQLRDFVERDKLRGMRLVPHLDEAAVQKLLVRAGRDRTNLQARVDLAWSCLHRGNPVDAGRWLAEVFRADPDHGQALLVRAELLHRRKETEAAIDCWRRGFANGADDFDSRIRFGEVLLAAGDGRGAEDQWQRAKACWPSCTEQESAPELRLARLYRDEGETTRAQMEMKAYCRRTARAFLPRYTLADFEMQAGNREEQVKYLVECNRIDPFHRELHSRLGEAYEALGQRAPAALEFEMAAAVLPDLDRRYTSANAEKPDAASPEQQQERAALWVRAAQLRHALADRQRAQELLERVLREAPATEAASTAKALQQEWQGR